MIGLPFQLFNLELTMISPVHVGGDQALDPTEYSLQDQKESNNSVTSWLERVDLNRLLASLDSKSRTELLTVIAKGDLKGVEHWLSRHPSRSHFIVQRIQVYESAREELERSMSDPNRLGLVELAYRAPNSQVAAIPGSAIKGAIRTALLTMGAKRQNIPQQVQDREFEEKAWGLRQLKPQTDPLRQFAVSDCILPENATQIDQIKIIKKSVTGSAADGASATAGRNTRGPSSGRGVRSDPEILMMREITFSEADGETIVARGEARLMTKLAKELGRASRPLTIEEIISQCNEFYRPRLEEELKRFPVDDPQCDAAIRQGASGLKSNEALLRIGRHSHFECVTVGPPWARPPRRGSGASRSRAGGILPLGWVRARFTAR